MIALHQTVRVQDTPEQDFRAWRSTLGSLNASLGLDSFIRAAAVGSKPVPYTTTEFDTDTCMAAF